MIAAVVPVKNQALLLRALALLAERAEHLTVAGNELRGSARLAGLDWEAPVALDFGEVEVGESLTLPVTVTNTGGSIWRQGFNRLSCSAAATSSSVSDCTPSAVSTARTVSADTLTSSPDWSQY